MRIATLENTTIWQSVAPLSASKVNSVFDFITKHHLQIDHVREEALFCKDQQILRNCLPSQPGNKQSLSPLINLNPIPGIKDLPITFQHSNKDISRSPYRVTQTCNKLASDPNKDLSSCIIPFLVGHRNFRILAFCSF